MTYHLILDGCHKCRRNCLAFWSILIYTRLYWGREGTNLLFFYAFCFYQKFSETDVIKMREFLIDNIFIISGGRVIQQIVGIPMGTNCDSLLADFFLYSYDADFIQRRLTKSEKKLARSFNFTFRSIDEVLSLNSSRFGDFVDRIYPIEFEIKDTTYTDRSASYLDLHLKIDTEGRKRT